MNYHFKPHYRFTSWAISQPSSLCNITSPNFRPKELTFGTGSNLHVHAQP